MTAIVLAPRLEDPTGDTEPILGVGWSYRIRIARVRTDSGQWVFPEWKLGGGWIPFTGVSVTIQLDAVNDIPYELQIQGPPDPSTRTVPRYKEFRFVTTSTSSNAKWETLDQASGPGGDPVLPSADQARLTALEAAIGSVSGGATSLGALTGVSADGKSLIDTGSTFASMRSDIGAAAASHTHVATTDLTATGTKNSSTFLRGDNTWAAPPAAGSPAWGDITGKPSTFSPTLPIAQSGVSNLVTDLTSLDSRLDALETNGSPVAVQELVWDGTTYKDSAGNPYDAGRPRHNWRGGPNPLTLGAPMQAGDQWTEVIPDAPTSDANLITIGSATHVLHGTDIPRGVNQLIRYLRSTTQTVTPTNQYGVEVTVSLTTGLVTAVNSRVSSGSTTGTTIPAGHYVLSGHGGPGSEEAGAWLTTNATVGAAVALTVGTPTTPVDPTPVDPQPGSGLATKVCSTWYFRWQPPYIRNWPSDVQGYTNLIVAGLAQSGGAGTGNLAYSPTNGQSVSDHAADIRAATNRGCPVLIGFGGSSDGGITITTEATAVQAFNSIVSLVGTYGFSGIDIDLEPSGSNWTQSALISLCQKLKAKYGAAFIIGATVALYDVWTTRWTQFMVTAGSNCDYIAPMLYDFVEASDSRLSSVSVQKCDVLVGAGVPQSKIILGYMLRPNGGYTNATPNMSLITNAWSAATAKYPNLRGVFIWEHYISSSGGVTGVPWTFQRTMGPIVQSAIGSALRILTFTATAASTSAINLAWTKSGTATGWVVARNGVTIATLSGSASSYGDSGLTAGTTYTYALTGQHSGGTTTGSAAATTTASGGGSGTWLSGGSGAGSATGAFATWRGEATPVMSTWASDNSNMVDIWPLQAGYEYGSWTGSADVSIGAINQSPSGILGTETWAAAASGSYDSRWTACLNKLKTEWTRISRDTCYIRFAHEMNGNWYGWSVSAANIANFIAAWQRFRGLQQAIFPAAKLVFGTNGDTAYQYYDWRTLWPGDSYVDVYATDWYSFHWADGRTFDGYGAPVGLEQHRLFAASRGKPFAVPEWGLDNSAQGDNPAYISYMHDFFQANGGTGPGKLLYECIFNVIWTPNKFGLYPRGQSLSPNAADRYVALNWGS